MARISRLIGEGILGLLFLSIFLFNMLGGIVGGIWLLFLGQWPIVLGGFLASITMPSWFCLISLPSLGLMALVMFFHKRSNKLGVAIIGLIAGLFDSFLIIGWITLVFAFFLIISIRNDIKIVPILLFSYSVSTSPIIYMASKEPPESENTNLTTFIAVIGSILFVILSLFGLPLMYPLIIMVVLMFIRTLLMTGLTVSTIPKNTKDYLSDIE